jgi:penicillin-binding protein 2
VYFYQVAERLGMDKIAEYAKDFGFGIPTGVEIPESVGIVPTRAWYASQPQLTWQPGLTLSVGIGQGSLTATPLQVARSFAIVANGGRLVVPRIIARYTDESGLEQQVFLPLDQGRIEMTPPERALIHEGLVRVVNDEHGTARGIRDQAIVIAGKTGTAEAAMSRPGASPEVAAWLKEDHAWFALYAPAEAPQVVITVFVEHGGSGGKDAAPLARRIFDAWRRLGLYRTPAVDPEDALPDTDDAGAPPNEAPKGPRGPQTGESPP